MSLEAMVWAMKQPVKPASKKFVLVALCDNARTDGLVWPSTAEIAEKTSLNRKTVIACLDALEAEGYLADTGRRAGKTGQVKVYQLSLESIPKTEASQERNSTDIPPAKAPEIPEKDSQNSLKGSQFSAERLPKTVHGISKEPVKNQKKAAAFALPDWVPADAWEGWLDMRAKAKVKNSDRALSIALKTLSELRAAGHDPGAVLDQSTLSGWKGLFPLKAQKAAPSKAGNSIGPYR